MRRRPLHVVLFLLLMWAASRALYLIVETNTNTEGIDLQNLQTQLSFYQTQNIILKEKVLQKQSLHTIYTKALLQGFVPITQKQVLNLH